MVSLLKRKKKKEEEGDGVMIFAIGPGQIAQTVNPNFFKD
jgi:hypothetical protein